MKNWLIKLLGGYTEPIPTDNKMSMGEYSAGFQDGYAQGYKMASPLPAPVPHPWVLNLENKTTRKPRRGKKKK